MSCSGLALWLKRLTEINMFLCRGFSKKKNVLHLLNHQDRRMEKKIAFGATVFSTYSGVLFFQRRNAYLPGWHYQQGGKYIFTP